LGTILVRSMRELIERFSYRYQLWREDREAERWGPDAMRRNPLRYVALAALMSLVLDTADPFVFHRAFDAMAIVHIPIALLFLILYQTKSKWAWYLVAAWVPFTFFAYWILRFAGYSRYQPRAHESSAFIVALFHVALSGALFMWLLRVRLRYFGYIEDENSQQT